MLMDYFVPGLEAEAFLTEVRRAGYSGKVVLCTAANEDLSLNVDAVLRKPFDPAQLSALVTVLLQPQSGADLAGARQS